MKRIAFFASFVGTLFLLAGVTYFFLSHGTKAAAVITGVSATNIIGSGAQIIWSTDVSSDSRVAYGISPTFLTLSSSNRCDAGGYVTSHCVNLTGLSANTAYYYKVESMDAGSVDSQLGGFQFTSASGSNDTLAPSIPAGLAATAISSSQINLSWTASTDNMAVVGYKVFRNGTQIGDVTAANYSDTSCASATSYTYTVLAYDAAGNQSAQSGSASAATQTPPDTQAPSIPSGLTATAISSSQVNLSWAASTDNIGVTGYKIYKNGTQITTVTGTSYSNTGLTAGTLYSYTVVAYDAAGNTSGQSSSASATTQASSDTIAPVVYITSPTASLVVSGTITVSATASDNIGVVGVQFKLDGANLGMEDTAPTYNTSWNTAVETNGSHTLTAVARDVAGNRTTSSGITVTVNNITTSDTLAPSIPAGLAATAISSSQINLSWTASTDNIGVIGYKIYRGGTQIGDVTTTSYSDTALTGGTSYTYTVAAYDAAGNISGQSIAATAITFSNTTSGGGGGTTITTDTTPPIITNVRVANIIGSGAQVKWSTDDPSDSLAEFGVTSGTLSSNSTSRCDAGGSVTEHCVYLTSLVSGTTYYYQAVSKNPSGLETKSLEYSFVSGSGTGTVTSTLNPVTFSVTSGTPLCKDGHTVAPTSFIANPALGGYFTVNNQQVSATTVEFLSGTYAWSGIPNIGYTESGTKDGTFTVPILDACSTTTITPIPTTTTTLGNARAYIALWQGDIHVVSGQAVQGELKVNVGVENADSVSIYLKNSTIESRLLGQAVRATDKPSLWRFSWDSTIVPDGNVTIFSRVTNTGGEYQGDSVSVVLKNGTQNTASQTTATEAASIVNELFAHPENVEVAKAFLAPKIDRFLQKTTVEEKQRAAEQIRKELGLDILVSNSGSVEVQVGTTTLSRQTEPSHVVEDISRMVKNRSGESVLKDTDGDGISDYDEVYIYNTDPNRADTDGDGVNDGEEILLGMNPLKNDITLVSYENPKEVTVVAKADPKEFSVNTMELISATSKQKATTTKRYVALAGTALPNSYVMIYIFSTPVVVTVKTDGDGKWKYTMDKELEDGNHEVYLAMTESAGKIIVKSDPIPFVKTAQAVTLQPDFAEASSPESPAGFFRGGTLAMSFSVLFIILGLSFMIISLVSKKKESSDDQNV